MTHNRSDTTRIAPRSLLTLIAATALAVLVPSFPHGALAAQTGTGFTKVEGVIVDSIHNTPLAKATVLIEGTGRSGVTDNDGHYVIDSIPAGEYRVQVKHPLLDTLGVSLRTPPYKFGAGESLNRDLSIPGGEQLAELLCTEAQRLRGPGAMVGFVRDPDTKGPATGAKVQLVFYETDILGRKNLRQRESPVDSTGMYKICGLPKDMSGKVQIFRNGVSSGEVPAEATNGFIAVRGFSVASTQTLVEVTNDSGKVRRIALGTARVAGRVVNKKGEPLRDARVTLQGQGRTVITHANGDFVLDSLPSGTQSLEVRRLGYSVTEVPVELSANNATPATITMSDAVPLLEAVKVQASATSALDQIGYSDRKKMGQGYFMDGKMIDHTAAAFSSVMRMAPGISVDPSGDGRTYVISDKRSAGNGCVNFYVDGTPWQTMQPGDIDSYVAPADLVAVEIYHGTETPAQYTTPGQSSCATIVAWTQAKISTLTRAKKK